MRVPLRLAPLLVLLILTCSTAFAHKVRIFAYAEGDAIIGETAFGGGRSPKNAEIGVTNQASGETLLTTTTDERGAFRFPIPPTAKTNRLDLLLVVDVGEGHRGEWLLRADEYLPSEQGPPATSKPQAPSAVQPPVSQTAAAGGCELQEVQAVVQAVVASELAPIKRTLAENRQKSITLPDILGGLGYILGLVGLAAYLQTRKKERN